MSNHPAQKHETVVVTTKRIACDGGGGALGHPKVWLDMGQGKSVRCKYCDREFILSTDAQPAGH